MTPPEGVTTGSYETDGPKWPPPLMKAWVNGATVPCKELIDEMREWVKYFGG